MRKDDGRRFESGEMMPTIQILLFFYFCERINRFYYSHIIAIRKEKMYFLFLPFVVMAGYGNKYS